MYHQVPGLKTANKTVIKNDTFSFQEAINNAILFRVLQSIYSVFNYK